MWDERHLEMAWQARIQRKRPKVRVPQTWIEGTQKGLKEGGMQWKGIRTISRDRKGWEALRKPSTNTGRRGSFR